MKTVKMKITKDQKAFSLKEKAITEIKKAIVEIKNGAFLF